MSQNDKRVAVYAPGASKPEFHTKPNARDLVVGAGYSWHPGAPSQPAAFAPFATNTPPSSKAQSQEVVDKVGGTLASMSAAPVPAPRADEDEEVVEEVADEVADEAVEEVEEDASEATETAPAARGRGRRPRGES